MDRHYRYQYQQERQAGVKIVIFTLLMAGILLGAGWQLCLKSTQRYMGAKYLADRNVTAMASITGKRAHPSTFGMAYKVFYTFKSASGAGEAEPYLHGTSEVSQHFFRRVETSLMLAVHYDPAEPQLSMLDLPYNLSMSQFLPGFIFGILFFVGGGGAIYGAICMAKRGIRLRGNKHWSSN